MSEKSVRRTLSALSLPYLGIGLWAAVDPDAMQATLADYGSPSAHLTHDYAAASVAAAIGLVIAARTRAFRPGALLVIAAWSLLHAISHAADLHAAADTGTAILQLALISVSALVFAALSRTAHLQANTD